MPIQQVATELAGIVSLHTEIIRLADGLGGDMGPAEVPLWWKESGHLVFSDIHNNRRMKWTPGEGVALVQEPTNYANRLT